MTNSRPGPPVGRARWVTVMNGQTFHSIPYPSDRLPDVSGTSGHPLAAFTFEALLAVVGVFGG